jgi:hypothetical protein
MSSIVASRAAGPTHALSESRHLTEQPDAADAITTEASSAGGGGISPTNTKLSPAGVVAQLFALELERRGIKLNLEQTAAKMGVESPPTDCTAK